MEATINHKGIEITFDDMEYQHLGNCDHSASYECRGRDKRDNVYSGIVEKCCDEYEDIQDIELILHARNLEKKPYQARILLKSIYYWQRVIKGELPSKKPLAYYKNKLNWYTHDDILCLEKTAKTFINPPSNRGGKIN